MLRPASESNRFCHYTSHALNQRAKGVSVKKIEGDKQKSIQYAAHRPCPIGRALMGCECYRYLKYMYLGIQPPVIMALLLVARALKRVGQSDIETTCCERRKHAHTHTHT